ncbi:54S ribosomal protein L17 mitochondrial [Chytridiales sp. JEL 0842]|nr:54S ribosomal protein L17 mitochondrial [Chytridiales sp. JEL 0842]
MSSEDPKPQIEEECADSHHCHSLKEKLAQCTERVNSGKAGEENCLEEFFDLMSPIAPFLQVLLLLSGKDDDDDDGDDEQLDEIKHALLLPSHEPAASANPSPSSSATNTTPTKIKVGLLLKRNPVILPTFTPLESTYHTYKTQELSQSSTPFTPSFYFKQGSVAEQRWLAAQKEVGGTPERPVATRSHSEELAVAVKGLAGRRTKADEDGDEKSLDRVLDGNLYLVCEVDGKWVLPEGKLDGEELLHEAASRELVEKFGEDMEVWPVGKAPVGVHINGAEKTFYMKHVILSGNPQKGAKSSGVKKYAWLTKDEVKARVPADYWKSIEWMLS